jgi:hypothetical protein
VKAIDLIRSIVLKWSISFSNESEGRFEGQTQYEWARRVHCRSARRSFYEGCGGTWRHAASVEFDHGPLEEQLNIHLFTHSKLSVSPIAAGERLLNTIGRHFEEIGAELDALSDLRDRPAGTVRITASDFPVNQVLLSKSLLLLRTYP